MHLPDRPAGRLLRCSAARLSVCRCRSPKYTSTTRTTCYGHPRKYPRSILVRHARFPRDSLPTSSRGCHKDTTRNKKHLKKCWAHSPLQAAARRLILHCHSPGVEPTVARRHYRTPPAHQCSRQRRRRRQQRQRVTEGTAMAP